MKKISAPLSVSIFSVGVLVSTFVTTAASAAAGPTSEGKRVRIDLGVGTGKSGDTTYTEGNVGVNIFLSDNIAFRNSVWGRSRSGQKEIYGLDTSMRGILTAGDADHSGMSASIFVAPGYRFVSDGQTKPAPFGEGGVTLRAGGLAVGGSVKTIFYKWVTSGRENETQYTVSVGGGLNL